MPVGKTSPLRPRARDDGTGGLGEDGVGVDVTSSGQRIAAGVAEQVTPAIGLAQFTVELLIERSLGCVFAGGEFLDQLLAGCRVGCVGDLGGTGGEELLFLQLDPLPGRVSDDAGEATVPAGLRVGIAGGIAGAEDVRELDVPVEEAVLAGDPLDLFLGPDQFQGAVRPGELLQDCLRDGGRPGVLVLGLDERGAPGVGQQLGLAQFR